MIKKRRILLKTGWVNCNRGMKDKENIKDNLPLQWVNITLKQNQKQS
jgi:hypothetical protein